MEAVEVQKDASHVTVVKGTPVLPIRAYRLASTDEAMALVKLGATLKCILRFPNDVQVYEFDREDAQAHKAAQVRAVIEADERAHNGPLAELVDWARQSKR